MKKSLLIITVILGIIIISAGCAGPRSQVGIMDMDKVLEESKRAGQLKEDLSDIGNDLEKNYTEKEKELNGENKEKELDRIYKEYVNNKQQFENKLNQEINQVLADISEKNRLDIILYKKNTVYGGKDITEKVIKRLDEKFYKGGASNNEKGKE